MYKTSMVDFYSWMKACLKHFGVTFGEMEKVNLIFEEDKITTSFEGEEISLLTNWKKEEDNDT